MEFAKALGMKVAIPMIPDGRVFWMEVDLFHQTSPYLFPLFAMGKMLPDWLEKRYSGNVNPTFHPRSIFGKISMY